ncbi:MAG: hypothetical protein HWE16_14315 [Gammaproteobacteria bacterium]|nr:hypothetical protein [Gammaproteobacteria bacterium]
MTLSACGGSGEEPAEALPPETEGSPALAKEFQNNETVDSKYAFWQLNIGANSYKGEWFKYYLLDGDLMIQLINKDAVNVALAYEGEPSGKRSLSHASFTIGRGVTCWQVGPDNLSTVRFESVEPGWLSGKFSATLGCPDASLMEVEGLFHIKAPGE